MTNPPLDVPAAWERVDLPTAGVVMVIGAPDTGKSAFARYLYRRLCHASRRVAFLDGDPGQSTLGPPSTVTLALGKSGDDSFPPAEKSWRRFVQAISPRGHMLPLLVSAARLIQQVQEQGAQIIVYDTTGFVDPMQGGLNLKLAKIELLRPTSILAIQRDQELEPLLVALRRQRNLRLVELRPSIAIRPRDVQTRQAHRASQFARYLASSQTVTVDWSQLAVLPAPRFAFHQLVALEDQDGFALGLGSVQSADMRAKQVTLLTPLSLLDRVRALRLGDLTLDPKTFRDQPLRET